MPGIEQAEFDQVADGAKRNCPVSRALAAVEISLETQLEIHHVNGNPMDNRIQNTIPLCRGCHQAATFPGI